MTKLESLMSWFSSRPPALVALSGGVDSALVAHAAYATSTDSVALTADYQALPREDLAAAYKTCKEIGIRHIVIKYDELEDESYAQNSPERCFYCRTQLGQRLKEESARLCLNLVVDGTHLDDMGDYRPGIDAMRSAGVLSPLAESGFSKSDVRACAQTAGLSAFDRPANSCLSSRIPWGQRITAERLVRIEVAENIVRKSAGIDVVRVRDTGSGSARIEVKPTDIAALDAIKPDIDIRLGAVGYTEVLVDRRGYMPGGANAN